MRRWLVFIPLVLLAVLGIAYLLDTVSVHFRSNLYSDVRVDSMYAVKNRWNEVEYSVGGTGTERCIRTLFPQGGYRPCWYVTSHTMHYIHIG